MKRSSETRLKSHKVFVRTSKTGNATKVVREQYLRQDIPCSSAACNICEAVPRPDGTLTAPVLSAEPNRTQKRGPHYTVVDTNVVLRAIDLLEHPGVFYDVVVPQTTLEEVRNRSLPLYNRLRNMSRGSSDDKRVYVFHNEYRLETATERKSGESINDRNDRAIRVVTKWYADHLEKKVDVVLITDDRANRELAKAEGVTALSLREYLKEFSNGDDLLDLVPESEDKSINKKTAQQQFYLDHYSSSRLLGGIKAGVLFQGNLTINQYNFMDGTVSTAAYPRPIHIVGRDNLNRAFSGDQVVVELLPKSQWKRPSTQVMEEADIEGGDGTVDEPILTDSERKLLAQEALAAQRDLAEDGGAKILPTGRVVGVLKRNWRFYVGHIAPQTIINGAAHALQTVSIIPMDKVIPRIRIRTRKAQELLGKRIVVAVDAWPTHSRSPEGHFVKVLGEIESQAAETEALLLEHDVEFRPFPASVLKCLPAEGHDWKVPEDYATTSDPQLQKRKDLRDLLVCSIDPPNCQDIDDALHAYALPNGNFHVGVHIADVTHFVKANTALDDEGASRGTSVYLVDKRIDMLPMLLGTDLCSLKPYVDRFAFSVLWELTPEAEIVSVDFTKSIIRSREAFAYEAAQARIDDPSNDDDLTKGMRVLLMLSKKLKQRRFDAGALSLASPEVKVHVDSETADPGDVEIKQLLDTNSLVEEFMLLANISVAGKIYEAYPQTAMLRRHGAPPATNFELLNDQLRVKKGMSLRLESSRALAESLDECVDPSAPFFNTLVRIMATRCMLAAEYFPSGSYGQTEFRHYGLASPIYTHFTSPIRRYADVVAHRQLAGAIGYETLAESHRDRAKMERICANINKRHRNAQFAGRASIEYYVGQVLKQSESVQEGFIIKAFSNGIVVIVPKFGVESLIKLEDLGDADSAVFSEDTYTLTVQTATGLRSLSVFDKVDVFVASIKDDTTGKRRVRMSLK